MNKFIKSLGVRAYEVFYGVGNVPAITVETFKKSLDNKEDLVILDVREKSEYAICHFEGARHIPLGELQGRLGELDKSKEIVVHCKMGGRSARAVEWLRKEGFEKAVNLDGGIDAWAERIDPSMPRY